MYELHIWIDLLSTYEEEIQDIMSKPSKKENCCNDCAVWKQLTLPSDSWTSWDSLRPNSILLLYLMPLAQNKSDFSEQMIFSEGSCLPNHTHQMAVWKYKSKSLLMGTAISRLHEQISIFYTLICTHTFIYTALPLSGAEAERSQGTLSLRKSELHPWK